MADLLQALPYLFGLFVLAGLWWTSARAKKERGFWLCLALAWSVNLLGNVVWGLYEYLSGRTLPYYSLVDLFYLGRYVLVGLAFWRYPAPLPARRTLAWCAGVLAAGLTVLSLAYFPAAREQGRSYPWFLGGAIYPLLDLALLTVIALRLRRLPTGHLRLAVWLLATGLLCYTAANWLRFQDLVRAAVQTTAWSDYLWFLADVVTALAIMRYLRHNRRKTET